MKKWHKNRTYIIIMSFFALVFIATATFVFLQTKNEQNNSTGDYHIEIVAEDLYVPWAIVFTDQNRILVTQRSGEVKIIKNGKTQKEPLVHFPVATTGEDGLMGLAKDPDYNQNKLLYACYTNKSGNNSVVRFSDSSGGEITTVFRDIPAAQYHAGCRIKFGPDDKLYITTGDATNKEIAQDINSLGGKILRINKDGSIPNDNPFNNAVWSYGHRNPQGIDWQPRTNNLISTEHGPSGFDGPGGGDEINYIQKGQNYGWPLVSHQEAKEGTIAPLLTYTPAVAPAGGMFYNGGLFADWQGDYFFGALRGQGIYHIKFDKDDPTKIISSQKLEGINAGRIREVAESPDGTIYFTTSNRDGRGTIRSNDDKIYRIVPADN